MPVSVGTKLGPYEILALIGKGGMGEVYRAHDSRLNRDVAIKASKAQFTERFTREARAIAALNHTNICHLYDVGPDYLVMEYVEGQDLCGPIDLHDALPIIQQLIDGIEAAHEKNIVHRDLKPANIKITPEGIVKILDFGLAKAMEPPPSSDDHPENSPTLTMGATAAGIILGTAAYMAPEQAKGKATDKRSDIWSFGVILYEVLTGKRLFPGETAVEILGAVLNRDPDISAAPRRVHKLLHWCLEKDRKQRLASISDARRLLIDADTELAAQSTQTPPVPWHRPWLPWCIAALLLLALVPANMIHFRETRLQQQTLRYTIAAPGNGTVLSFAMSPDGRAIVIAAAGNGKRQLWLQPLDALQAQPMSGTEDAIYPFWSPDSRHIGFFAQSKLKKIAASGGPAQSLCNVEDGRGGSWDRDDVIVFSSRDAIQRIPADGGLPANVTKTEGANRYPVFLPDGRHFLYSVSGAGGEQNGVYISSLDGKENRRVLADTSSAVFTAGYLLFIRENTVMAQAFDASSAKLSGEVFPIAEGVSLTTYGGTYAPVSASESGALAYASDGGWANQIAWFDRGGKFLGPAVALGYVFAPSISPDEKMIAFVRTETKSDIWLRDLVRGTDRRFTSDGSYNFVPIWAPHSDRIIFRSDRDGHAGDLHQRAASGSAQDELLVSTSNNKTPNQWSRDGQFIVYSENDPKTKWDVWVFPVGDRKPIRFTSSDFSELQGQLSPDGRWMAYASDETGHREVYVRPYPPSDGIWRISTGGGEQPRWRGDGKELFFVAGNGHMTAVPVKAVVAPKPSFEAGVPISLFETRIVYGSAAIEPFQYDVTADGKRFLVDTISGSAFAQPLTVVTNWIAGLKK